MRARDVRSGPRHLTASWLMTAVLAAVLPRVGAAGDTGDAPTPTIGARGHVGCGPDPRRVRRLSITEPGVYENILVDGDWTDGTLVKITADGVTLRNCEVRNGTHNAVAVYAKDVVIDSCKIHHVLASTYDEQRDAHGITGRSTNLTVHNCDIGLTSGDAIQFDPGRGPWGDVLIEGCTLWTAPLPADAAGFKAGQRPGENAVDTKQRVANPRSRLTIRDCLFTGWQQPGPISNMAALNLKNHVEVRVEGCLFRDNEICLRVRGGAGEYGGALVTIEDCAAYDSRVAVRAEDGVRDLKVRRLGLGAEVGKRLVLAWGGVGPGFEDEGGYEPRRSSRCSWPAWGASGASPRRGHPATVERGSMRSGEQPIELRPDLVQEHPTLTGAGRPHDPQQGDCHPLEFGRGGRVEAFPPPGRRGILRLALRAAGPPPPAQG